MRTDTRCDHEARIKDAVHYILDHLDECIDLGGLSDRACMSRFHFHRVFHALLGETAADMVRRLRLERAAAQLNASQRSITELAFESGYATHESFIRAFRLAFGCTPSMMRKRLRYQGSIPTQNGLHYDRPFELRFIPLQGDPTMTIEIRELPTRKAACIAHSGPYFMIGPTFGRLAAWKHGQSAEFGDGVALFYDDPESTPAEELRSEAGVFVPDDFTPGDSTVHIVTVEGGAYAVATHHGTYESLPTAWTSFTAAELPEGHTFRNAVPFEVYVAMDKEVGGPDSVTELYLPVTRI